MWYECLLGFIDSLEDTRWWEVFPLWAVSVLVSGPAPPREPHPYSHRRETVHVWLLRTVVQTETAAASTHQPLPCTWLCPTSTTWEGWADITEHDIVQYDLYNAIVPQADSGVLGPFTSGVSQIKKRVVFSCHLTLATLSDVVSC